MSTVWNQDAYSGAVTESIRGRTDDVVASTPDIEAEEACLPAGTLLLASQRADEHMSSLAVAC